MNNVIRTTLTLFGVAVTYLLIYHQCFSDEFRRKGHESNFISLSAAIVLGIVLWKKIGHFSHSLLGYTFAGGILVAIICFIVGFFGPLIVMPSSNQGPLLGIFFGPVGFLLGLFIGAQYWHSRVKK